MNTKVWIYRFQCIYKINENLTPFHTLARDSWTTYLIIYSVSDDWPGAFRNANPCYVFIGLFSRCKQMAATLEMFPEWKLFGSSKWTKNLKGELVWIVERTLPHFVVSVASTCDACCAWNVFAQLYFLSLWLSRFAQLNYTWMCEMHHMTDGSLCHRRRSTRLWGHPSKHLSCSALHKTLSHK